MTHGYIQEFMLLMLVYIKGPFGAAPTPASPSAPV